VGLIEDTTRIVITVWVFVSDPSHLVYYLCLGHWSTAA
jgi:hypothetical protein